MSLRKWMKKNLNETNISFGKNLFLYIIIVILYFPLVPGDLEYYTCGVKSVEGLKIYN